MVTNNNTVKKTDSGVPERSAVKREDTWDLERIYTDDASWQRDFDSLAAAAKPLLAMQGKLNSAAALADMFRATEKLDRLSDKLYVYAHLKADEDTASTTGQARQSRILQRITQISGDLAWITPEILSHTEDELRAWMKSKNLQPWHYSMEKLVRAKPHVLSPPEETLLSRAGEIFSAPRQAYKMLTDADMRFPEVENSLGEKRELTDGRYSTFLISRDRTERKSAFKAMYDTYSSYKNTLASTLASNVKLHNYMAQIRHHESARHAALYPDQIPVALYESLLTGVHDALPAFYDYVELRREALNLPDLNMYDFYVPLVPEYDIKVPFEQACEWVLASCAPLGEEYCGILKRAFTDRWIDVYENRGKRSGAYSSGCYDTLPYVLMNYQGTLNHVFTLAHELGHSMHSWLANHTQPHQNAAYPIFIAEIASTLNEELLLRHLLDTTDDPAFRAYLLNHLCDAFKGTVYRQTMFAEYEQIIHELDAAGEPLTHDTLNRRYYALNEKYYGPGIKADPLIAHEWARIPHFYYNFYVYKYATSFCASQLFISRIFENAGGVEKYLGLLKAGGSRPPLELIRNAGVDLENPQTLTGAFENFGRTVRELRAALKKFQ
ncbi:MAG: oligoendopeptidase F [Kiritimatiellia bacterium]